MKHVAVLGTGCGNGGGLVIVTKCSGGIYCKCILTVLTNLGGITVCGTGGSSYSLGIGVDLLLDYSVVGCLTVGAGVIYVSCLVTGSVLAVGNSPVVSGGSSVVNCLNNATNGTGVGGISTLGTGRSGYYGVVAVGTSDATNGAFAVLHGVLTGSGKTAVVTYGTDLSLTAGGLCNVPGVSGRNDVGLVAGVTA